MGSGKSTYGKKLATKLNYDFIDTDAAIERMTGKPIAQIFAQDGEDSFRQLERSILVSLTKRQNIVVSTGGGTPCFFDNMALMNKTGVTVYLQLAPESLAQRLIQSKSERPLLQRISNEELPGYIKMHLFERESFYKKSGITIKGENLKIDDLYKAITGRTY